MEKEVTSHIIQLSLGESLEKMIGPSSVGLFLLDSICHERSAFEKNWSYFRYLCVFGSPEISLEFSRGGIFYYPLEVCL